MIDGTSLFCKDIFGYLLDLLDDDFQTKGRLAQVCHQFRNWLLQHDTHWERKKRVISGIDNYSTNHEVTEAGFPDVVRYFIRRHACCYQTIGDGINVAAGMGRRDLVNIWLQYNCAEHLPKAICSAARNGHRKLVYYLIQYQNNSIDWANETHSFSNSATFWGRIPPKKITHELMESAAQGGLKDIVELMIQYGANNWYGGLNAAASGGRCDLFEMFLEKGANPTDDTLSEAIRGGKQSIIDYLVKKNIKPNLTSILIATNQQNKEMVKLCFDLGIKNHSEYAFNLATSIGNLDIIDIFIDNGCDSWYSACQGAQDKRNPKLAEIFDMLYFFSTADRIYHPLHYQNPFNVNMGLAWAARGGHRKLVDLFIENGADDWDQALKMAAEKGCTDLINFLKDKKNLSK